MFVLGKKSLDTLVGVDPKLVLVVKRAIQLTQVDFRVNEGVRTIARQKQLLKEGKTQTLKSKHIEGKAFDLVALKNNKVSWDMDDYVQIAEAVRIAAIELNVQVRWGCCWIGTLNSYPSAKEAMDAYIKHNKKLKKSVFLDGPHFELV
jgi:hypothetical protein